ncbi:MAG: AAA family ATPase [Deltaproteobacteria bacterium]|nr:AAA family ATPase [Deltaproteobacteria bacterium]
MKIVACYSTKGGVGKTASSVNLAYWAARSGYKTLLIDLDPQGASSYYFRIKPTEKNWGKRFLKAYGQVLKQIKASDYENLDLVPAHRSFRHFDTLLDAVGKRKNRLRQVLKGLKDEYDLVLLDCPPTFSRLAENIFTAADLILVPVIPTTLSERSFAQLNRFFKEKDYHHKKLLPFFTMVDIRKNLHRETALSMRKRYKRFPKYAIPYSTDVEKMGVYRAPIDIFARRSQANSSYRAIWKVVETTLFH